ncbi:hypothetical protein L7D73_001479 [Campylobacter jejuni]|nr:hypothetical protein [Campylobacter jejuni]
MEDFANYEDWDSIEVIGNIHENVELLEVIRKFGETELHSFDFRIWDNTKKKYLSRNPSIAEDNEDDILVDFEIELWTGLHDNNRKNIFEGDIVKVESPHDCFLAKVSIHKEGTSYLETKSGDDIGSLIYLIQDKGYDIEVIGNIHNIRLIY